MMKSEKQQPVFKSYLKVIKTGITVMLNKIIFHQIKDAGIKKQPQGKGLIARLALENHLRIKIQ